MTFNQSFDPSSLFFSTSIAWLPFNKELDKQNNERTGIKRADNECSHWCASTETMRSREEELTPRRSYFAADWNESRLDWPDTKTTSLCLYTTIASIGIKSAATCVFQRASAYRRPIAQFAEMSSPISTHSNWFPCVTRSYQSIEKPTPRLLATPLFLPNGCSVIRVH